MSGAHLVLPVSPGRPGVLYFVLQSDDRRASAADVQRLKGVTVAGVGRAEMHQSMDMAGMTTMRPLADVPMRNGVNRFCPGALHVMLFDLQPAVKSGTRTRVTLDFATGDPVAFDARVLAFGQTAPRDEPYDCRSKV